MTCEELLTIARKERPSVRYARNPASTAIAGWSETLGRFQVVASMGIDGKWYSVDMELLINDKPAFGTEWLE